MGVICQGNTEPDNPKIQKQINKLIMHQEIMAYWSWVDEYNHTDDDKDDKNPKNNMPLVISPYYVPKCLQRWGQPKEGCLRSPKKDL